MKFLRRSLSILLLIILLLLAIFYFIVKHSQKVNVQIYIYPGVIVAQKGNMFSLYTKVRGLTEANQKAIEIISNDVELKKLANEYSMLKKKKPMASSQNDNNYINVHMWHEICGINIENILKYTLFPHLPASRTTLNELEMNSISPNMGLRIFGYISVPVTGKHQFILLTDNADAQFWFSYTGSPLDTELLCQVNSLQKTKIKDISEVIQLTTTKVYFLDIVIKTGKKMGTFFVKWLSPESQTFIAIEKSSFSSYYNDIDYDRNEVILDYSIPQNLPMLHMHKNLTDLYSDQENFLRSRMPLLGFIPEKDTINLYPYCEYSPSYLIHSKIAEYQGVWETHYSSIYPTDHTNVSYRLLTNNDQIIFGNDLIEKNIVDDIVFRTTKAIKKKHGDKYSLSHVLNIERNHDPVKGDRFLVELALKDKSLNTFRFSEYVYKPIFSDEFCYPKYFKWNKSAVVNIILTVGNQGRWAKHFINTMSRIYDDTKDTNLNVVIVDFDSKDIDIARALKESSLPRYTLIKRKGLFHKTEAIQAAVNTVLDPGGIVMQVDLHMTMPSDFIDHVRKHTVQGKMACSPLLLRLQCGAHSENTYGFWEISGYGIFGVFKSDWDRFGGIDVMKFRNKWGGEDWDLLDRVLIAGLEVERLKVPHLNHVFHTKKGMWNSIV